jgi:hypothetical protein
MRSGHRFLKEAKDVPGGQLTRPAEESRRRPPHRSPTLPISGGGKEYSADEAIVNVLAYYGIGSSPPLTVNLW